LCCAGEKKVVGRFDSGGRLRPVGRLGTGGRLVVVTHSKKAQEQDQQATAREEPWEPEAADRIFARRRQILLHRRHVFFHLIRHHGMADLYAPSRMIETLPRSCRLARATTQLMQLIPQCHSRWLLILALFPIMSAREAFANAHTNVHTVFLILMENVNWPTLLTNSASAPYLVNTLLPMASYCNQYYTPPGLPGSLPNYLWLEAGTNFGITDSSDPSAHVLSTTNHLTTQLRDAGISWKAYVENISGANCATASSGLYAAYHNPFVYFTDIISNAPYCLVQVRPYTEFAVDLMNNTVARYNFIIPNLCHDSHDLTGCETPDRIRNGDNWLASEVPRILASASYTNNGALFIAWDEGSGAGLNGPIGMIVLSPLAKGHGYASTNRYTHASMLRTAQEIFDVRPFLADAANATSLSDLFLPTIYLTMPALSTNGHFQFDAGVNPGKTNVIQATTNLADWFSLSTNVFANNALMFTDTNTTNFRRKFYRTLQLP